MNDKEQQIFAQIPAPPPNVSFSLLKLEKICIPHPYCITPKHVEVAADYHSGYLNEEAIEDAENVEQSVECISVNFLFLNMKVY